MDNRRDRATRVGARIAAGLVAAPTMALGSAVAVTVAGVASPVVIPVVVLGAGLSGGKEVYENTYSKLKERRKRDRHSEKQNLLLKATHRIAAASNGILAFSCATICTTVAAAVAIPVGIVAVGGYTAMGSAQLTWYACTNKIRKREKTRKRQKQKEIFERKNPTKSVSTTLDDPCSICLEEMKKGDLTRKFHCNHIFHQSCSDRWLEMKNTCPLCQQSVLPEGSEF